MLNTRVACFLSHSVSYAMLPSYFVVWSGLLRIGETASEEGAGIEEVGRRQTGPGTGKVSLCQSLYEEVFK